MKAVQINEIACSEFAIKSSSFYKLREKIDRGESLSDDEKALLVKHINNIQDRGCVVFLGWRIPFHDITKVYLGETPHGTLFKVFALDEQSAIDYLGRDMVCYLAEVKNYWK